MPVSSDSFVGADRTSPSLRPPDRSIRSATANGAGAAGSKSVEHSRHLEVSDRKVTLNESVTPPWTRGRMPTSKNPLPGPGGTCINVRGIPHVLQAPDDDTQLQTALATLMTKDLPHLFGTAVESSINYVLDGPRTGRFDLNAPEVDSDERRTVGTKLQYHLLDALELPKLRSPDTEIAGVPVDIKATVGGNWSIPREAQCELCILVQINAARNTHRSWLMRTHREWLHAGKGNGDQKRGVIAGARQAYAVPLYDTAKLAVNPLRLLDPAGAAAVFQPKAGMGVRLKELFSRLSGVIFPRDVIQTVGFGLDDPLRRAREAKPAVEAMGFEVLVGTWVQDRARADQLGVMLPKSAWIAFPTNVTTSQP
jgi:Restriction endonuclease NaeI